MNKDLMIKMGFAKQVFLLNAGFCTICEEKINLDDFTDELSKKEFVISGMCQICQDDVFNLTTRYFENKAKEEDGEDC